MFKGSSQSTPAKIPTAPGHPSTTTICPSLRNAYPHSCNQNLSTIEAHTGTPLEQDFYKDTVLPTTPADYEHVATPKTLTDYADEKTNEVAQTPRPKPFTKPPVTLSHEKLLQHNNRLQTLFATEAPFRRRYLKRFRFSKKTFGTPTLTARDKGRCNSLKLKMIMMENIEKTPTVSKRAIQKAASAEIGGSFDVVCSKHDFSYLANTRLYCETRIADIVCFAFMHEPEKETSFQKA
uniref:Ground-like domain-containing protein n=1 Tax=Panagrellus redivivus TaxID=6233 RepID=A0A7E4VX48_PANRE